MDLWVHARDRLVYSFLFYKLDIMEHPSIKDVIVLQTVREELRHLSLAVYNRLNAILADKNRRFYLFANEHHR